MKAAALLAAGALAAVSLGAAALATAESTIPGTPSVIAAEVAPFEMTGLLQVHHLWLRSSSGCAGASGYNDMRAGTNVTVWDAEGKVVGAGQLGVGTVDGTSCTFLWTVPGIPRGRGPYQYEVAHRGRLTVTEAEARGIVSAELGTP